MATLSFHVDESGFSHAAEMPAAPLPNTLMSDQDRITQFFEKRGITHDYGWPIDVRYVAPMDLENPHVKPSSELAWVKANGAIPDLANLHTQLLAYASDNPISSPAFNPHGRSPFLADVQGATLSHALWFHRPVRIDDWLLFDLRSDITFGGRGLCEAKIFNRAGHLVATATQEILMRDAHLKGEKDE